LTAEGNADLNYGHQEYYDQYFQIQAGDVHEVQVYSSGIDHDVRLIQCMRMFNTLLKSALLIPVPDKPDQRTAG